MSLPFPQEEEPSRPPPSLRRRCPIRLVRSPMHCRFVPLRPLYVNPLALCLLSSRRLKAPSLGARRPREESSCRPFLPSLSLLLLTCQLPLLSVFPLRASLLVTLTLCLLPLSRLRVRRLR